MVPYMIFWGGFVGECETVSNIIRIYYSKLANPLTIKVWAAFGEQPPTRSQQSPLRSIYMI